MEVIRTHSLNNASEYSILYFQMYTQNINNSSLHGSFVTQNMVILIFCVYILSESFGFVSIYKTVLNFLLKSSLFLDGGT